MLIGHILFSHTTILTPISPLLAHIWGCGSNPQDWSHLISASSHPSHWLEMISLPPFSSCYSLSFMFAVSGWLPSRARAPAGGFRLCLCWRYSGPPCFIWFHLNECHSVQQTMASPHHNTTLLPIKKRYEGVKQRWGSRPSSIGEQQDLRYITARWQTLIESQ